MQCVDSMVPIPWALLFQRCLLKDLNSQFKAVWMYSGMKKVQRVSQTPYMYNYHTPLFVEEDSTFQSTPCMPSLNFSNICSASLFLPSSLASRLTISIKSFTMGAGLWQTVLPFKDATSGPYNFSVISMSPVVTGQFLIFILMICLKSAMEGQPSACKSSRALLACETWWSVKKLLLSSTFVPLCYQSCNLVCSNIDPLHFCEIWWYHLRYALWRLIALQNVIFVFHFGKTINVCHTFIFKPYSAIVWNLDFVAFWFISCICLQNHSLHGWGDFLNQILITNVINCWLVIK